jgi:peptidoglycan/LPS O-acetylase OafA/YrhL
MSDEMPVWTFLRNRFARIYPATATSIVAAILLPVTDFASSSAGVTASLLLVQAWVPTGRILFAANGVTWSL